MRDMVIAYMQKHMKANGFFPSDDVRIHFNLHVLGKHDILEVKEDLPKYLAVMEMVCSLPRPCNCWPLIGLCL